MNKILLASAVTVLLLAGCGDEKKTAESTVNAATQAATTNKDLVAEATKNVDSTVSKAATEVTNTVSEATNKVVEETVTKLEEVKETTKDVVVNVVEETKIAITPVTEKTQEVVSNAEAATPIVNDGLDGELLFKSCASCHGLKAEKEALGKSQVIAGWNKEKIIQTLNGYKDGSYGGVMKNIMKGQVATKTDAEIDALSTFISNL
jgi:cytochrome c553